MLTPGCFRALRMRYSKCMDENKRKLDRLRTQYGLQLGNEIRRDASAPAKTGGVLSEALARQLRARLGLPDAPASSDVAHAGTAVEIDAVLPGHVSGTDADGFFLCRRRFPLDHYMGDIPLGAALDCQGREIALSACDDALLAFAPRTTCYMDTETTGLSGGAGTVAFLVGVGFFEDDAFVLEQCFLRDYDDEAPMLAYLSERLPGFTAVVSYNGKSFDMPLLRARFVQHRIPFPFEDTPHYDLVHAARRVWRRRLNDCSLANIEREVLGFRRRDDVPGSLIPQLWLDYLDSRDARPLAAVFQHHALDVLSLAALSGHLANRLARDDGPAFHHAEDQLSVIRLHYKRKQYDAVIERGRAFLDASRVTDALRRECLALVAQAYRRTNRFEAMEQTWRAMHDAYPEDAQAAEALAKCLEHRRRDLDGAMDVCRATLAHIEAAAARAALPADFGASTLRGRLARLEQKAARRDARRTDGDEPLWP